MPKLKKLTDLIDEIDSDFKKIGGRIFITHTLVTKIKTGAESPIVTSGNIRVPNGLYQKLCEELIHHGIVKDRYRIEETYLLTKAANGEWSVSSGDDNHSTVKRNLPLSQMTELKKISTQINKVDPQFQTNGGRIFITPTRIYRLKNKMEVDFKLVNKSRDK